MAERSSPVLAAFVSMSWTFPITTARTAMTEDYPAPEAEDESSAG